jgi:hypothetical protein
MYVRDETPFTSPYGLAEEGPLTAVGWLDASKPFAQGHVPRAFVERLRGLCQTGVNKTRGYYQCSLCPVDRSETALAPTRISAPDGDFYVGHAEIRVSGAAARYAAPDMVIHYVTDHGYRPPRAFVDAVLSIR